MSCVHTGARLYLSEYGGVAVCDAHSIGGSAVFRISGSLDYGVDYEPQTMYKVFSTGSGWFGRGEETSTLIVDRRQVVLPASEQEDHLWPYS